jgi:hypothetical protein
MHGIGSKEKLWNIAYLFHKFLIVKLYPLEVRCTVQERNHDVKRGLTTFIYENNPLRHRRLVTQAVTSLDIFFVIPFYLQSVSLNVRGQAVA